MLEHNDDPVAHSYSTANPLHQGPGWLYSVYNRLAFAFWYAAQFTHKDYCTNQAQIPSKLHEPGTRIAVNY